MSQYNGLLEVELNSEYTYDVRNGYTRVRKFRGRYATLLSKAEKIKTLHDSGDATEKWFLTYNLSQPDPQGYAELGVFYQIDLTEIWTLDGTTGKEDVWLKGEVVDVTNALTTTNLAYLRQAYDQGINLKTSFVQLLIDYPNFKTNVYDVATAGQKATMESLYRALLLGNTFFPLSQVVIRRSVIVPNVSLITTTELQPLKVGMAFTKAVLLNYWPNMPQAMQDDMYSTGYYVYQTPSIRQQASGKLELIQDWQYSEAVNSWLIPIASI